MSMLDAGIIIVYFVIMIGIGVWQQRRASRNIDSYFLGGNQIHWLALAMCGSVSTYDISGTMWMVALVYLFGMKSVWNHWMWGFMMAAFFMAFMGKWVRRSRVMTGAEWMITRFGDRGDGRAARYAYALMAVVTLVGLISYAFEGVGKFSAEYVQTGLDPETNIRVLAIGLFAITTIYTLLGGLEAVVITHVLQTIILMTASVIIAGIAYFQLTPEKLAAIAPVDGGSFTSLWPQWELNNVRGIAGRLSGLPDVRATRHGLGCQRPDAEPRRARANVRLPDVSVHTRPARRGQGRWRLERVSWWFAGRWSWGSPCWPSPPASKSSTLKGESTRKSSCPKYWAAILARGCSDLCSPVWSLRSCPRFLRP